MTSKCSTANVDQGGATSRAEFGDFDRPQQKTEDFGASPGHESGGTTQESPETNIPWGRVARSVF